MLPDVSRQRSTGEQVVLRLLVGQHQDRGVGETAPVARAVAERRVGAETEAGEVRPGPSRAPALQQPSHGRRRAGSRSRGTSSGPARRAGHRGPARTSCRPSSRRAGSRRWRCGRRTRRPWRTAGSTSGRLRAVARRTAAAQPPVRAVREVPERDRRGRVGVVVGREPRRARIDGEPARSQPAPTARPDGSRARSRP